MCTSHLSNKQRMPDWQQGLKVILSEKGCQQIDAWSTPGIQTDWLTMILCNQLCWRKTALGQLVVTRVWQVLTFLELFEFSKWPDKHNTVASIYGAKVKMSRWDILDKLMYMNKNLWSELAWYARKGRKLSCLVRIIISLFLNNMTLV